MAATATSTSTRASTTGTATVTTTTASVAICVELVVKNVDYAQLVARSELLAAFEDTLKGAVASELGDRVDAEQVAVSLSAGSVNVRCTVHLHDKVAIESAVIALRSPERIGRGVEERLISPEAPHVLRRGLGAISTGVPQVADVRGSIDAGEAQGAAPPAAVGGGGGGVSLLMLLPVGVVLLLGGIAAMVHFSRQSEGQTQPFAEQLVKASKGKKDRARQGGDGGRGLEIHEDEEDAMLQVAMMASMEQQQQPNHSPGRARRDEGFDDDFLGADMRDDFLEGDLDDAGLGLEGAPGGGSSRGPRRATILGLHDDDPVLAPSQAPSRGRGHDHGHDDLGGGGSGSGLHGGGSPGGRRHGGGAASASKAPSQAPSGGRGRGHGHDDLGGGGSGSGLHGGGSPGGGRHSGGAASASEETHHGNAKTNQVARSGKVELDKVTLDLILADLESVEEAVYSSVFAQLTGGQASVPKNDKKLGDFLVQHTFPGFDASTALPGGASSPVTLEGFLLALATNAADPEQAIMFFVGLETEALSKAAVGQALLSYSKLAGCHVDGFAVPVWEQIASRATQGAESISFDAWGDCCTCLLRILRLKKMCNL